MQIDLNLNIDKVIAMVRVAPFFDSRCRFNFGITSSDEMHLTIIIVIVIILI